MSTIPTIDMRNIDSKALLEIDLACRDHGFFKLIGHGLNDLIDQMWGQASLFFAAPRDLKVSVMRTADNAFGYYDRELTKQKRDQKETFDFHGNAAWEKQPTLWPDKKSNNLQALGLDVFESTLKDYYAANTLLAERVLQLVCRALGKEATELDTLFATKHTSLARLNHYPSYDPLPEAERDGVNGLGNMALHHHTDPGGITLLYQDDIGGLQTLSETDGWIDVPPEEYSFVVNLGDLMQVWSNDQYKAAVHRVIPVPSGKSRYSMPYFYSPAGSAKIASLIDDQDSHYRPFTWGEYGKARSYDNFSDLGQEDTQVTDYRLKNI